MASLGIPLLGPDPSKLAPKPPFDAVAAHVKVAALREGELIVIFGEMVPEPNIFTSMIAVTIVNYRQNCAAR
jgi:hypothetical protein